MSDTPHPAATPHLPWFLPGPDGSDSLFTFAVVLVLISIVLLGVLFFTLHSLPERLGHKKLQFEIVAVLGLLSLFTHNHAFWVAGLLLALIDLPDVVTPLGRMSSALEKLSGMEPTEPPKTTDAAPAATPAPVAEAAAATPAAAPEPAAAPPAAKANASKAKPATGPEAA